MLEIKNTTTEMKNVFDWLISRLAMERLSELKDKSVENFQTEMHRDKIIKTQQNKTEYRTSKNCKCITHK